MENENKACSYTGLVLHLNEINKINLLKIFSKIIISFYVKEELSNYKIDFLPKNFEIDNVNKDQVLLIAERYSLNIGESLVIWLNKNLKIPILLTDDLDAREVAISLDIKVVGTIGVIIRSFREDIIDENSAIQILKDMYEKSSLFVTRELIML
ncbi:MAG TPA: hypothetical protein VJJ23_01615 [Candidatus Nanoarchaeia archaeon]|nr:hypothetical protein [Candidatus Nanoarchaeia archaeon]